MGNTSEVGWLLVVGWLLLMFYVLTSRKRLESVVSGAGVRGEGEGQGGLGWVGGDLSPH